MMAALQSAPDSPATQLEPAEDGSECDADPEEEEEEEQQEEEDEEEEEEVVVEEVATPVQEVAEVEVEANSADNGGGDDDDDGGGGDDDVEEVLAEEQTLSLGTQERHSNGGHAKAPVLQGKGKNGTLPLLWRLRGWGHEGGIGPRSEVWEDPGAPTFLPARYHWL
jgi:hypothetical protein